MTRNFKVLVDEDKLVSLSPGVPDGEYELVPAPAGQWLLIPQLPAPRPYRVVDGFGRGWLTCHETPTTFPMVDGIVTFEQLDAERGPLIPVVPPRTRDTDELRRVLAAAGVRAATTVLSALHYVEDYCLRRDGHDQRLVAGRPGSWESAALLRMAHIGDGSLVEDGHVDEPALQVVEATIKAWIFDKAGFVEVAENLAAVFGDVIDGRGGWQQVIDDWLPDNGHEEEVYRYLASRSRWYGPGA